MIVRGDDHIGEPIQKFVSLRTEKLRLVGRRCLSDGHQLRVGDLQALGEHAGGDEFQRNTTFHFLGPTLSSKFTIPRASSA